LNNFQKRTAFALVGIPACFFLMWLGDLTRLMLFLFLTTVAAFEFYRAIATIYPGTKELNPLFTALTGTLVSFRFFDVLPHAQGFLLSLAILVWVLISFQKNKVEQILPWLSLHLFGFLYLVLWVPLARDFLVGGKGLEPIGLFLYILMAIWISDSGAYFSGKAWGKHKLCREISPKKTWEGFAGGTILVLIFAGIVASTWLQHLGTHVFAIAIIVSITGPVGDLLMSVVKRYCGVKDFSQIFPGHGGVLDRCDSLFFTLPFCYFYLSLITG
jgi:phosphatidate cytidylyltransferase